MISATGDFIYAKLSEINITIRPSRFFFTVKCNDSVSFSFLFPCFFFMKDQIASFQLKQIIVFRVCVYFIA